VETVPQIVTRGWLVNATGLGPGGVIGPEQCAGIDPEPGDAILFHTGWGRHWDDPETYLSGEPGPGCDLAQWLADHEIALTGCDTWSFGPVPPEDPERPFRVPQILNIEHGVFVVENLNLAELAAAGVTGPFALILTHPKLRGATGAWTSPIALI
jgi:kynurenine formamidase